MSSEGKGIAMGCTTCGVDLLLQAEEDDAVRRGLSAFFDEHDGCDVFMDVSGITAPLPGRPTR